MVVNTLGHPVGATGAVLITKALYELKELRKICACYNVYWWWTRNNNYFREYLSVLQQMLFFIVGTILKSIDYG